MKTASAAPSDIDLDAAPAAPLPAVPWRRAPLVYLAMLVAVLAITWPWATTFSTHVLKHWDPPFHAWKLELVARSILSGHLVPPSGDTNVYYPNGGTLYYEALHWPQALAAAPLFALPNANPVLIYHVILVGFWALSGLCFWAFLRALGAGGRASLLGALFFTVMPYRTSYMVEFNMQLNFALPLFLFFFARYFQRPSIRYACGLAFAVFLQASSELYQAVFLALLFPFLAIPFVATRPKLLISGRKFWLPLLVAALACLLAWPILGPYLTLLDTHTVNRTLREINTHRLEPLSYLLGSKFIHFIPLLQNVRHDEMSVYPSLALLLLAGLHLALNFRSVLRTRQPRWALAANLVRWGALLMFLVATIAFHYFLPLDRDSVAHAYAYLGVVAVIATLVTLFHPARRDLPYLFSIGLLAAAIVAFFLSFGPEIRIAHATVSTPNVLFRWLYAHLQALSGFRVVSRFSIFVLIFLCVAAALGWDAIERRFLAAPPRAGRLRRIFCASAFLLPALLCAAEAWPRHTAKNLRPMPYPIRSATIDELDRLNAETPHVLAIVPMGDRNFDSAHMLRIDRTDRLSLWAWGGAYPPYTQSVQFALRPDTGDPRLAADLLRQLWPDVLVLEDLDLSRSLDVSYADFLAPDVEPVARDDQYALFRLADPAEPAPEHIKLVRDDIFHANPVLSFTLEAPTDTPPGTFAWLDLNGYAIAKFPLVPGQASAHTLRIPATHIIDIEANRLRFHADGDAPFFLRDYAQSAPAPDSPAPAECPSDCPPWSAHLHALPPDALPIDVPYACGLRFVGVSAPDADIPVAPGGIFHAVLYLQGRVGDGLRMSEAISGHDAVLRYASVDGPRWFEGRSDRRRYLDPCDFLCQAHDAIHVVPLDTRVPADVAPGDYTMSLLLQDTITRRNIRSALPGHTKHNAIPITIHVR